MDKKLSEVILKEVDEYTENIDKKDIVNVLNELFNFSSSNLLRNLGDQEEILDDKDALPDEFWEGLIDLVNQSYAENSESWDEKLKEIKFQILCSKYFTKRDLPDLDKIEKKIRLEIKHFYSSLQNYTSLENFEERFFNLPSELLLSFVRFILNKSLALNKKLAIKKEELIQRIKDLKEERKKMITKISFISNKNQTTLDLSKLKKLVDNGLFYEDNFLNRGVNEYIYKLVNHKEASKNIIESFNSTFLDDLRKNVEQSNSYMSHIVSIKQEEGSEFFSVTGIQIGRKFDNEMDIVEKNETEDSVIDKDSIFKEPKARVNPVTYAWDNVEDPGGAMDAEGSGSDASGGGGGFSGGGGSITPGSETFDMPDDGSAPEGGGEGEMPTDEDGFPVDFGTPESNDVEGESSTETDDNTEEEKTP